MTRTAFDALRAVYALDEASWLGFRYVSEWNVNEYAELCMHGVWGLGLCCSTHSRWCVGCGFSLPLSVQFCVRSFWQGESHSRTRRQ